ncbi:MAG: penicillin-binding protein 2 [Caulobacterales bacterium 32-67-6]|nr:MAG: penicillin-binding protein 2 [Caulobacterales bacterium 32-67-6]
MSEPSIFFSEVNERQGAFHRRSFLLGGFAGAGLLALGGRLAHLQILEAQRYQKLSASNQFNFRLVPPPRGLIVDRNGAVLATNRPNFRLLVVKDGEHEPGATLKTLAHFVPLDDERQARLMREFERTPNRTPVSVMEDMTWEQFSAINVRAPEMPNVTADMGEVRVYPHGGAFAHVIGYVAKVNREDITETGPNSEPILLHPGFRIGRQGVEKAFDLDLRGRTGAKKVEVDARGREIRNDTDGDIPAEPGKTVELTLDVDIQNRALEVMGDESGAIVVMDCRSGDLLCMVSAPSFDANRFVRGLSTAEYRALADYERRPLLDKAMSGTYPPGSTFKMTTALAALAAGVDPEQRIHCSGGWRFGGRTWRCWRHGGHGPQNMHDAIKNSCDVYFYQVALRMGPDHIARAAKALGFGQAFDIGIPGQRTGVVGSTEWKRTRVKRDPTWHPGDSVSYGIGQGYITANGLQLAVMTARLANGRKQLNPRLIKSVGGVEMPPGDEVPNLPFSQEHLDYVRAGMIAVANDTSGTAYRQSQLGLGDVLMAGKTGTAQVRSYDGVANRDSRSVRWGLKDHNLYVAFAPIDQPRYAISVIIQHGGLGGATAAAPRAREVMRVALLKDPEIRARIIQPMPLPDVSDVPLVGVAPEGAVAAPPPRTGPSRSPFACWPGPGP